MSSPSPTRRVVFALILIGLVVAVVEGISYVAYPRITGESIQEPAPAVATAPDSTATPDVKPGREQAGLGFKDPNLSLHPFLGYVYTPPAPGDEPRRILVSKEGFLDTASAIRTKDPSRVVVAIQGGSVAGQLGTWHSDRFIEELESVPEFAGRTIDLVRLGMPGYHQPQQVIQLSYLLAQGAEFDVVINIDGFNEIAVPAALNTPQGAHPLFPMNWSMVALDVPDLEVRRNVGAVEFLQNERARRRAAHEASVWSRSALAKLFWKREDQRLEAEIARHTWQLQEHPIDEIPWFVTGPPEDHEPADGLVPWCVEVWKRSSLQLQALCDANDIRYLHVLQPNQYVPGSKPLSNQEQESAFDPEGPYRPVVESGYPLLRAAGEELVAAGVEFVDLTMLFEGHGATFYVDVCCHFNGDGNAVMSEAIANALQGSG